MRRQLFKRSLPRLERDQRYLWTGTWAVCIQKGMKFSSNFDANTLKRRKKKLQTFMWCSWGKEGGKEGGRVGGKQRPPRSYFIKHLINSCSRLIVEISCAPPWGQAAGRRRVWFESLLCSQLRFRRHFLRAKPNLWAWITQILWVFNTILM